jgi:uncharacterized protein with beta-barrel porin domain
MYSVGMSKNTNTKKHNTGAGVRREQHFANGGTLAEWRGGLADPCPERQDLPPQGQAQGGDE